MRRLKRIPAAELAIKELRTAILTGLLPPGHRVKSEELAAKMGVSRMPVRQALSLLEREGLVRNDRWRGMIITPLDAALIRDVYELRSILEQAVASALAERNLDPTSLREIVALGRQAAAGSDVGRAIDLDLRFHTSLYDAFGNAVLSDVMLGMWGHVRRAMHPAISSDGYRSQAWDEHEAIVEAIAARDPRAAAAHAEHHIASASREALRNLETVNAGPEPKPRRRSAARVAPRKSAATPQRQRTVGLR